MFLTAPSHWESIIDVWPLHQLRHTIQTRIKRQRPIKNSNNKFVESLEGIRRLCHPTWAFYRRSKIIRGFIITYYNSCCMRIRNSKAFATRRRADTSPTIKDTGCLGLTQKEKKKKRKNALCFEENRPIILTIPNESFLALGCLLQTQWI